MDSKANSGKNCILNCSASDSNSVYGVWADNSTRKCVLCNQSLSYCIKCLNGSAC